MPRRPDAHLAYWYDFEVPALSGYPGQRKPKRTRSPVRKKDPPVGAGRRRGLAQQGVQLADRVSVEDVVGWKRELRRDVEPRIILVSRDRQGFRWEREVGLSDDVPLGDAAQLLGVPLMRVHRWIRAGELKSKKLRGYAVVRVRALYELALQLELPVPHGRQLNIIGAPARNDDG